MTDFKLLRKIVKLAKTQPQLKKALMPIIKEAMEFDTQEALDSYLKKHPKAEKSNHSVKKNTNSGKRDKGTTLSNVADRASAKAKSQGYPYYYLVAAGKHEEAAAYHKQNGNHEKAKEHELIAERHRKGWNKDKSKPYTGEKEEVTYRMTLSQKKS